MMFNGRQLFVLFFAFLGNVNAFSVTSRSNVRLLSDVNGALSSSSSPSSVGSSSWSLQTSAGSELGSSSASSGGGSLQKAINEILSKATSALPFWVIAGSLLGVKSPAAYDWTNAPQAIECMLALVMVGMGMTLEKKDFTGVLCKSWSSLPFGVICQYGIMPLAAWFVGRHFLLPVDPALFLGLVLVGCSPGGTASNLVTLIAGANVALSVLLTACSTFLAAAMTPLLVNFLMGGTKIMVNKANLFLATGRVVLAPVLLGMLLNAKVPRLSKILSTYTLFASVLLVAAICGSVVARNAVTIQTVGSLLPTILKAIVLTHTIGFLVGYVFPKYVGGYEETTAQTISIETGMQNSALAVVLAQSMGAPAIAALPGAISAVTHSCLGSMLAAYWRKVNLKGGITNTGD